MKKGIESQRGVKHIGLIIAGSVLILAGALVGWRYLSNQNAANGTQKVSQCGYPDDNLCKFFTKWKSLTSYQMVSYSTDKASNTHTTLTMEVSGNNSHVVIDGPYAHEMIIVGESVTYTKAPNGVWWKREASPQQQNAIADAEGKPEFQEPTKDGSPGGTSYTYIGTDACGNLTCLKYQIFDPESPTDDNYLWFDTKDHLVRRSSYNTESFTNDLSFTYNNVTVTEPTSFKVLNSNQALYPGRNEPTTLQTTAP